MNREIAMRADALPAARREAGSAYLIVLLVLVVLTILGLSLVLITKSEMEVGANERGIQRVFYDADSGVAIAAARLLVANDHRATTVTLDEAGAVLNFKSRIDLAPVVPLADAPCNLCEINNAGTYNERAYRRINNLINSRATRVTTDEPNPLGHKLISTMLEIQPWKSSPEDYAALTDSEALAKMKF